VRLWVVSCERAAIRAHPHHHHHNRHPETHHLTTHHPLSLSAWPGRCNQRAGKVRKAPYRITPAATPVRPMVTSHVHPRPLLTAALSMIDWTMPSIHPSIHSSNVTSDMALVEVEHWRNGDAPSRRQDAHVQYSTSSRHRSSRTIKTSRVRAKDARPASYRRHSS
jgi:hypothetical protein